MTVLIYNFDLDARRTARIPAHSQAEADAKLQAYLDSTDESDRYQFEIAYVEYEDTDEDAEGEEAEREGLSELVRAILTSNIEESKPN
jgi:hypothetical protein